MEVALDQTLCRGDCICEQICARVFALDDAGIAHVVQDGQMVDGADRWVPVPADMEDQVRDAATECPTGAIRVRDEAR